MLLNTAYHEPVTVYQQHDIAYVIVAPAHE